jgi:hypothetical protein
MGMRKIYFTWYFKYKKFYITRKEDIIQFNNRFSLYFFITTKTMIEYLFYEELMKGV